MSYVPGAGHDLDRLIRTHLFVVCPNNSGSSFLSAALGSIPRQAAQPSDTVGEPAFEPCSPPAT